MKRKQSESGKENKNAKRQKVIHSSYYGKILDGKRDGIQKIIVSGGCEPLGMICPFVNGIKHGECYTFYLNTGKLINCSLFENGQIVQQLDLSRIEITTGILDFIEDLFCERERIASNLRGWVNECCSGWEMCS